MIERYKGIASRLVIYLASHWREVDPKVLELVRSVHSQGGLVATICHGPWVLISAGIVKGRRLTSTVGIKDDVVNAGGIWEDSAVVVDGNIVSSRVVKDLPEYGEALIAWLKER